MDRRARRWRWLGALVLASGLMGAALAAPLEANTATEAQLQTLKGVGPVLAQRLVQARQQRPFADWADLQRRVPGIGPRTAEQLSIEGLRVNGRSLGSERAHPNPPALRP